MTLEPPRELAAKAGKTELATDAEVWRAWGLSRAGLSRFLRTAQAAVGLAGEVDVLLAGDRTLRRLNRKYRGKDKATDVLSFPAYSFAPAGAEVAGVHGGDLAISLDTARRQAEEHGHALRDEIRVLLLHGLLHLSGMDHETDRGEMAERERELRRELGLRDGLIERVAEAGVGIKATARANTGVLRFAQDDGEKRATATAEADPCGMTARKAKAKARARASATATAKAKTGATAKASAGAKARGAHGVRA